MTVISSKAASRRFFSVLKEADEAPVVIERHGRPRAAVVSICRFRLYEKLLAHISEEAALAAFEEAIERADERRLGLANRARKKAAQLGRRAAPGRTAGGRE